MLLGCIADDFTGATDLANTLTRQGMSTVVLLGVPRGEDTVPGADAVVIALKSRSTPAREAVEQSLAALQWLKAQDARQFFFKYCSTFDSTDAGNIGPVGDALLDALRESFTIACPAFPANGRTLYQGHLFVGGELLSESGMRNHPVTPMTDALLTRVLQRQTKGRVGLIPFEVVDRGEDAIVTRIYALQAQGYRYAIVDALDESHLHAIGRACAAMRLVTGGSGVALGLPGNFRRQGLLRRFATEGDEVLEGPAAVLAGSCSTATQRQVAAMKSSCEALALEADTATDPRQAAAAAAEWAKPRLGAQPVLVYSTADPAAVAQAQSRLGREAASAWFEQAFAAIAQRLVAAGVRRLIVAGGETSGAVVQALGIKGLRIGAEIDPGVPWTTTIPDPPLALALKSGNFGTDDFFLKALRINPPDRVVRTP